MRYLIYILLGLSFTGCSDLKRFERFVKKNPEVVQRYVQNATVITTLPSYKITSVNGRNDTLYFPVNVPVVQIVKEKTKFDKKRERKLFKIEYERELIVNDSLKLKNKKLKADIKSVEIENKLNKKKIIQLNQDIKKQKRENRVNWLEFIVNNIIWIIFWVILFILLLYIGRRVLVRKAQGSL